MYLFLLALAAAFEALAAAAEVGGGPLPSGGDDGFRPAAVAAPSGSIMAAGGNPGALGLPGPLFLAPPPPPGGLGIIMSISG